MAALAQEPNLSRRGPFGQTALMVAAEKGFPEIVSLLLRRGADVNTRDDFRRTVLLCAVGARMTGLAESAFLKEPEGAPERVRLEIVEDLLAHGADVNAQDAPRSGGWFHSRLRGETPLVWAVRWDYVEVLKTLLEQGADARGEAGRSALEWAEQKDNMAAAALLKQAGAKE